MDTTESRPIRNDLFISFPIFKDSEDRPWVLALRGEAGFADGYGNEDVPIYEKLYAGGIGSLGSLLGFLAVLGLTVRSTLVLVSRYRDLESAGAAPSPELVQRGTRELFGSIVTTAIVAAVVFAPIALLGNIAGLEILHSMAAVVIGGVISSTLVSLLVVPALYLAYAGSSESLEIIEEEEAA